MTCKIAFFNARPYEEAVFNRANADFGFHIYYYDVALNPQTASLAKGYTAVCVFVNDVVDQKVIDVLHSLDVKLIALRATGYDNIDLIAAKDKLKVVRVPNYSPYCVAEHAVGLMLSLNRKIHFAFLRTRMNNFSILGLQGFEMHGKTAGVIGAGRIGKAAIQILNGFGMRVLAFDIDKNQVEHTQAKWADLNQLYQESDVITLHCPLTRDNVHMINKQTIAQMKRGIMIINTGRGGLICTRDLIEGLKSGKIGACGLDVYENEKEIFHKDLSFSLIKDELLAPLLSFPNVLITAHQGYFTQEALQDIAVTTLKNIQEFFNGRPLTNEVQDLCSP